MKLTFLGTGTSFGIPQIGCHCAVCRSPDPRDKRTRVGAYAICLDETGRILLCRIAPSVAPGEIWTLPGGGLDFGEPPETAVIRELREESGYIGDVVALACVADRLFDGARPTNCCSAAWSTVAA